MVSAIVVLALIGCGSTHPMSAADVAAAWISAMDTHNWQRACELSALGGYESLGTENLTCPQLLDAAFRDRRLAMRLRHVDPTGSATNAGTVHVAGAHPGLSNISVRGQGSHLAVHFNIRATQ